MNSSANKLASGLAKLEDAREQVETLSKELEIKKVVVAKSQKDCEDLLVQIVSDKRIADEQVLFIYFLLPDAAEVSHFPIAQTS